MGGLAKEEARARRGERGGRGGGRGQTPGGKEEEGGGRGEGEQGQDGDQPRGRRPNQTHPPLKLFETQFRQIERR